MILVEASRLVLVLAVPGVLLTGFRYAPRWWTTLAGRLRRAPGPAPHGPPIEQLAADLRRLLRLHGALSASAHHRFCAHRMWAVEAAIGTRAIEAATALDVPHPHPERAASLTRTDLSRLLSALSAAGLALPDRVGGFTTDGRL